MERWNGSGTEVERNFSPLLGEKAMERMELNFF